MSGYAALAPVYDSMTRNVDYARRCGWIDEKLRANGRKGIVLDAGCGTGTLALLLAKKGYDMVGVDRSPEMLAEAYAKSARKGADVRWLCQELRELDLYGTVNAVICMQDTVNHLPPGDLEAAFARFSLFTEPGGLLLFDHNTEHKHRDLLAINCFVIESAQGVCVWQNRYDAAARRVRLTVDVFRREGKLYSRATDRFSEYTYTDEELDAVLLRCGYELVGREDGEDFGPVRADSERILVCARKKL